MKKFLLPNTGDFYKANLHIHSSISDGEMSPDGLAVFWGLFVLVYL